MPHSFSVSKTEKQEDKFKKSKFKVPSLTWENFTDWVYLLGGITFVIGSIFFLPKMEAYGDTGVWVFIVGSLMYLLVTVHELNISIKSIKENTIWARLEFLSAIMYVIGTVTYLLGSILFLSELDQVFSGAICFIIGSILFLIGALINVLEITNASSNKILQLMNGTAIMYISGSLLFLVASIPYVWHGVSIHDQSIIYSYVAVEYIAGSLLFALGGVISMIKTYEEKPELNKKNMSSENAI